MNKPGRQVRAEFNRTLKRLGLIEYTPEEELLRNIFGVASG